VNHVTTSVKGRYRANAHRAADYLDQKVAGNKSVSAVVPRAETYRWPRRCCLLASQFGKSPYARVARRVNVTTKRWDRQTPDRHAYRYTERLKW